MEKNQFNCIFLSRKGFCKKTKNDCQLKNLLMKNGAEDKKEIIVTFLDCYLKNLDKGDGKQFFRTALKQITGIDVRGKLSPLTEYEANLVLNVLRGNINTHLVYSFRIPDRILKFNKLLFK